MSFSSEQKNEIIKQSYKSSCCRRSLLMGFLFGRATLVEGDVVSIRAEKLETIEFIGRLIKEFYSKSISPRHSSKGGRYLFADFESPAVAKYIRSIECGGELFTPKCDVCESSFLRGVFLSSGKICDPERQYLLEFSLGERTDRFVEYLTSIDLPPNIANKKTGRVVYYRHSAKIEDFTARASMNSSIFAIMNEQISSDLDNYVQRVSNCTAGNISKTVDAAMKYNNVIVQLDEANLLSSLPEELAATARLRLEYSDLTLAELARISVPPISKSGLAHRLNKILELSEKLLGNDK
jgi:DNA-binding protein WhiA